MEGELVSRADYKVMPSVFFIQKRVFESSEVLFTLFTHFFMALKVLRTLLFAQERYYAKNSY